MELKAFSIRDSAAEVFNTPFFARTPGEAERQFEQLVNDEKSVPFKRPEHFDLYYIGDYDDNTGKILPMDTPQHVVKGVQLKQDQKIQ